VVKDGHVRGREEDREEGAITGGGRDTPVAMLGPHQPFHSVMPCYYIGSAKGTPSDGRYEGKDADDWGWGTT